jgi:hypothetical protein
MRRDFTREEAFNVGTRLSIDWDNAPFTVEDFRGGMDIELEHGSRNPETNITWDDPIMTGKIVLAHLRTRADYYAKLASIQIEPKKEKVLLHSNDPYGAGYSPIAGASDEITKPSSLETEMPIAASSQKEIPSNTALGHRNDFIAPAIILAFGFLASVLVGAYSFYAVRSLDHTVSVTGSAKKSVQSDTAKWSGNFSRRVTAATLTQGYTRMNQDLQEVRLFLNRKGTLDSDITVSPVFTEEVYEYSSNGDGRPREYVLRQTVTIHSKSPDQLTALANAAGELASKGVFFAASPVEYFYSKLPDLRVELLSDALIDARRRAEEIAGASGTKVGTLRSAQSGVVQVMSKNSVDVADFGAYDTGSAEKEIMVTVRASFLVR